MQLVENYALIGIEKKRNGSSSFVEEVFPITVDGLRRSNFELAGNPSGIALDVPGGKVYWTDSGFTNAKCRMESQRSVIRRSRLVSSVVAELIVET